jgi:hypothetical protein
MAYIDSHTNVGIIIDIIKETAKRLKKETAKFFFYLFYISFSNFFAVLFSKKNLYV